MGPIGEELKIGEAAENNTWISYKNGNQEFHHFNGDRKIIIQGTSWETYGKDLARGRDDVEQEAIAKSIKCENGDLVLSAPNGNVKIIAKNIYVETVGAESDGSIIMKANDHITIKADEQLNLGGGKVCMTAADSITLNAKGFLRLLYADVMQGSPLSGALSTFLPGPVASLISDIAETCK
jgi:hypothetical protein